jgi:hypothetical protein
LAGSGGKEEGRWPGAAGIAATCERTEQRKGKGRKEEEGAPTGGVPMSAAAEIKEKRRVRRATAGRRRWAAGPLGPKGKKVSFVFSFSFPNLFQFKLFLSNSNQNSSNLFTKFNKLFKLHSSNQKLCKAK